MYNLMKKNKKAAQIFYAPEPPENLAQKIISRIERRERRILFAKMACSGMCIMGSLSLVCFGFTDVAAEFSRSGFFSFASLIFSDFYSAIANFPDFISSVTESIPAIPMAFLFGGIVFFLWSAARFINELSVKVRTRQFSILN